MQARTEDHVQPYRGQGEKEAQGGGGKEDVGGRGTEVGVGLVRHSAGTRTR